MIVIKSNYSWVISPCIIFHIRVTCPSTPWLNSRFSTLWFRACCATDKDEDRKGRRLILTGSADVMTSPHVADSLAGRIEIHNLLSLSLTEILGKRSKFLSTLVSTDGRFQSHKHNWKDIIEAIRAGGYPEALKRETEGRKATWFESYIGAVLQKDIRNLANIEGLTQLPTSSNL